MICQKITWISVFHSQIALDKKIQVFENSDKIMALKPPLTNKNVVFGGSQSTNKLILDAEVMKCWLVRIIRPKYIRCFIFPWQSWVIFQFLWYKSLNSVQGIEYLITAWNKLYKTKMTKTPFSVIFNIFCRPIYPAGLVTEFWVNS